MADGDVKSEQPRTLSLAGTVNAQAGIYRAVRAADREGPGPGTGYFVSVFMGRLAWDDARVASDTETVTYTSCRTVSSTLT